MANATTEFDFDDENLGPKALRDFAKAQAKQNDALQKQLKTIQDESRARTVQSLIKEKGLPEKVAKLVPADADPTEWLTEYGDVFGAPAAPAQQAQTAQTQQAVVDGSPDGTSEIAQNFAELQAMQQLATNQQSAGQANPQYAALQKAADDNGAPGIAEFMRALNLSA
jgi:hypothetical protein